MVQYCVNVLYKEYTGHSVGAPLPLTASVMEMMQWMKASGYEAEDHSALVRYFEHLAQTGIRSQELLRRKQ